MGLVYDTIKKGKGERPPIWLMRQAGRYMQEYRDMKEKYSFFEMCYTPELTAEITLQPLRKFDMDAAIIFSDILLILKPLGLDLEYKKSKGPIIHNPIRSENHIKALRDFEVKKELSFIKKAIQITRKELDLRKDLIGFAGAPFTVACYAIEGAGSKNFSLTKSFLYKNPESFHSLMRRITQITKEFLLMQIDAGANIIQLFDSWGGLLSSQDYREEIQQYNEEILQFIAKKSDASSILFVKGNASFFSFLGESRADALGVDWSCSLSFARQLLSKKSKTLQGNLDPSVLLAKQKKINEKISSILEEAENLSSFIFNLGHGILPETPVDNVLFLVEKIKNYSYKKS